MIDEQSRQVFDLPDICLRVTEHVVERRRCACGHETSGAFSMPAAGRATSLRSRLPPLDASATAEATMKLSID
ncbi:MAG TPA: hypothetical protein VFD88_02095 [Clostridia bacterium]|nr:hypothetical protein [Clostridia bacterium]